MPTPEPNGTPEPAADEIVVVSNELVATSIHNVVQAGVVHDTQLVA